MTEKGEENAFNGFYQHTDSVYSVDLSEDGFKAISGGGDDLAYLWKCDVRSSEPLEFKALTGHSDSVISVSFNVDFSKILTASMDGTIRVYSVSDGTFLKSLDGPSKEINWIKVHKNYDYVLSGSADGTCWTFNLSDLENPFMSAFARHLKSVSCGDFCDFEGTNAITASDDGQIFQWNYGDGSFERYLPNLNSQITNVSISSQIIIASTVNGSCVVISLKSGNIAFQLDCGTTSVESASLCNFDKFVFATSLDGSLGVWDISTKRKRFKLNLKSGIIVAKALVTKPLIVCALDNGKIVSVDYRSGDICSIFDVHSDQILDFVVSKDEKLILSCGEDNNCIFFKLN